MASVTGPPTGRVVPQADDVEQVLRCSGYPTLRFLKVKVADGVVIVRGYVRSYYEKQMGCQAVKGMEGVLEVRDLIEVFYD